MTDLERFFRRLVGNLASTDPARLHRPLPLTDVRHDIVPYRANRRALALDSSEDYEMVLLRLCAGEGGLVRTEPEEARARFVKELGAPNPDLAVLQAFDNVVLTLRSEPLARALGPERDRDSSYTPPPTVAQRADPEPESHAPELPDIPELDDGSGMDELFEESAATEEPAASQCFYCGGHLPAHRAVNFCPHCGQSQTVPTCAHCRSELEPGWRHCVNCGKAVGDD